MYEDCAVRLRMTRMIRRDGAFDESVHPCKVIRYHADEERIYLLSGKTELSVYSLDGIYECMIDTEEGCITCSGTIKERYWSKAGKVMVFQVENGFYKNNLK